MTIRVVCEFLSGIVEFLNLTYGIWGIEGGVMNTLQREYLHSIVLVNFDIHYFDYMLVKALWMFI